MRVIKCDICGKELNSPMYTDTGFDNENMDLCGKCHNIYNSIGQSYMAERHEIWEKRESDLIRLKEKYKKKILELRENS